MIQDIAPHVYHNEYRPEKPSGDSFAMVFNKGKLAVKVEAGEISFPTFQELEEKNPFIYEEYTFLFSIDDMRFYLLDDIEMTDYQLYGRKELRTANPQYLAFAGVTASQLYGWYKSHKYCGKCGKLMKHDEKERMVRCEECGQMEYPKICPAVIVGVTNGNRLLLSKYAGREHTRYALIAGFAEIGESIEETVKREVMEEVGLKVKNITYYKSQPWSVTDTLLFGFYVEVDGSDEITLDEEELALAEWFEREEIPVTEVSNSLTNEMILKFKYRGNL
ncbi:MAG: NAD(+) diphosphatase [Tyzzerella sp.]|nr:NAD(+) diphosphatase [Tyzzerella sp.]